MNLKKKAQKAIFDPDNPENKEINPVPLFSSYLSTSRELLRVITALTTKREREIALGTMIPAGVAMAPGVVERGEISAGQLLENRRPVQSRVFRSPQTLFCLVVALATVLCCFLCVYVYKTLSDTLKLFFVLYNDTSSRVITSSWSRHHRE